jgi:NAD-dependent SIR2 family protein deacetylase
MGVDSGLPDFRSNNGFWKTYPALGKAGIQFESVANPNAFLRDARLAWGFYGHRLNLYRQTIPHDGFRLLQDIGEGFDHGTYVVTSNVDGQFQKAGFGEIRINEIHGSIHHLQCMNEDCQSGLWSADTINPVVDEINCRMLNELPTCPSCGGLARPNILMFGDSAWQSARTDHQAELLVKWLKSVRNPLVIEIGAGIDVPTIRHFSDRFENLIRINPRMPTVKRESAIALGVGGLNAIRRIYTLWSRSI